MRKRLIPVLLLCLMVVFHVAWISAGVSGRALNEDLLGMVWPLQRPPTWGSALNDVTLQNVITAQGATAKRIIIQGAWTIANNLNIPPNIHLEFAPDGVINVNSGRTLTVQGHIPDVTWQIFGGLGNVVIGGRTRGVYPQWFGAKCDGVTNDAVALQKALTTAGSALFKKAMYLTDSSNCITNSALSVPTGVSIIGSGYLGSTITVGPGVRGLVYEPGSLTEAGFTFENFRLIGGNTSLDLLTITNAGNFALRNMNVRTTGGSCIRITGSFFFNLEDVRVEDCATHGVHLGPTFTNSWVMSNVNVHSNGMAMQNGFYFQGSAWGKLNSPGVEGVNSIAAGMRFEGAAHITVEEGFIEFVSTPIIGATLANHAITIRNMHVQGSGSVKVDFSPGSLAHTGLTMDGLRCVAIAGHSCFHPGSSTSYTYRNAVIDPGMVHVVGVGETDVDFKPANSRMRIGYLTNVAGLSRTGTRSNNLSGDVGIVGTNTSATVVFNTPEGDDNYNVHVSIDAVTGSPPVMAARARSKTSTSFLVELSAAPGAGNSVRVVWVLIR